MSSLGSDAFIMFYVTYFSVYTHSPSLIISITDLLPNQNNTAQFKPRVCCSYPVWYPELIFKNFQGVCELDVKHRHY